MANKLAHLEMILGVINRLANNSFLLKGWSVTIVSAIFALSNDENQSSSIYLVYFPALAFWVLDGYFLHQERLFRKLYDHVRRLDEELIDFSMNVSIVSRQVKSWDKVIFSKTLLIFHGMILSVIAIVTIARLLSD